MLIRKAQITDAPALATVMVDTWLATHRGHMSEAAWQKRKAEWSYEVSEGGWAATLDGIERGDKMCIYVAEDDTGAVAGLAVGFPTKQNLSIGEISALYVRIDCQGQGMGRKLVQAVAAYLAALDVTVLHIAVLAVNTSARRFYEAIGGQIVGERDFDEEGVLLPEVLYGWPEIGVFLR